MKFNDILCQDKAIGLLQHAFTSEKSAHAYIFAGQDGIGRYKTAYAWAALLLCDAPAIQDKETGSLAQACGMCHSCRAMSADAHPDYYHVYKELRGFTEDGKNKAAPVEMPIDVIREFLLAKVGVRPTQSRRKVFIVREAQKLNKASQNALLKVLEEPPAYCCIILLCTRLERLLPTIKSRVQIIRFGPVDERIIQERLIDMELDTQTCAYLSRLAQGSLGFALTLGRLEENGADLYNFKRQMVHSLARLNLSDSVDMAQDLVNQSKSLAQIWGRIEPQTSKTDLGRRAQTVIIRFIVSIYSDAACLPYTSTQKCVNTDQSGEIDRLSHHIGSKQATACVFDGFEAMRWIEAGVNERLVFERLLLRAASPGIMQCL